jgi:hypothetical protein
MEGDTMPGRTRRILHVVGAAVALAAAVACGGTDQPKPAANDAAAKPASSEKYPEPRFPSYFKPATAVDELLPAARLLVRNRSGLQGAGLGILEAGDSVLIVPGGGADPMVLEAIKRALVERKITPHMKTGAELQAAAGISGGGGQGGRGGGGRGRGQRTQAEIENAGVFQASQWITGQFPNPEQPKAWLKARRPDIYAQLFPREEAGAAPARGSDQPAATPDENPQARAGRGAREGQGERAGAPVGRGAGGGRGGAGGGSGTGDAIKAYLKAHPEVKGVFWGSGGTTGLRRQLYPMQAKYLGTFAIDSLVELQSQMPSYPGDVWQLAEEQLMEPITYAAALDIKDPEGTDLKAELTEDMENRWAQGAYQRGHLYMFPNQATGRFGYSFVDYPAFNPKWLPREPITRIEGVLGGTVGHGGFYPRWEITFKNGFISGVKGGGAQGEALKEFLQYPGLNDLVYPYHTTPGYWYLYEIAFGSHPKAFREPAVVLQTGSTIADRVRSGVVHWGLGIRLWHDPDAPTESKQWADFTQKHNVPRDHGWHTHTYFTTYKV